MAEKDVEAFHKIREVLPGIGLTVKRLRDAGDSEYADFLHGLGLSLTELADRLDASRARQDEEEKPRKCPTMNMAPCLRGCKFWECRGAEEGSDGDV